MIANGPNIDPPQTNRPFTKIRTKNDHSALNAFRPPKPPIATSSKSRSFEHTKSWDWEQSDSDVSKPLLDCSAMKHFESSVKMENTFQDEEFFDFAVNYRVF